MDILRSYSGGSLFSGSINRVVVITLQVATLLVTLLALHVNLKRKKLMLPPGPFAWPVVGNFPALVGAQLPHRVLHSLATKYGGLMYLRLGSVPTIVVSTVAVAKELFQMHDATCLDRPRNMVFDIVTDDYKNMMVANGRYWRQLRKLCSSELFTARRLATYQGGRTEEIHTMMKELVVDSQEGRSVDLKSWVLGVIANDLTRMLINKRYFGNSADSKKEKDDFGALMACISESGNTFVISDFVPYLLFITKLQGWQQKLEKLRDWTYDVAGRMLEIEKHRLRAENQTVTADENYVPDFVDVLLETPLDDGKILPDKNLTLILTEMLFAGTDTSTATVEWAVAELIQRPEIMQQLQDELNNVIGADKVPQESDIPNLPFLQAVVKETFRLHPPISMHPHRAASKEFQLQGYRLPKDTRIVVNFFAIHRDPSVWDSPDEFRPERFVERKEVNHLAGFEFYELIPFSAGRRMCPAYELGNMMVCSLLAHLMHAFEWELPKGEAIESVDMAEHFALTVCMKKPLRLVAKPKSPAFLY